MEKQVLLTTPDGEVKEYKVPESDGIIFAYSAKGRKDDAQVELVYVPSISAVALADKFYIFKSAVMESPKDVQAAFKAAGYDIRIQEQPLKNTMRQIARSLGL